MADKGYGGGSATKTSTPKKSAAKNGYGGGGKLAEVVPAQGEADSEGLWDKIKSVGGKGLGPVVAALQILDMGRRGVMAGVKELDDLVPGITSSDRQSAKENDFDISDLRQNFNEHIGAGDMVDTGNAAVDRALGFIGDVGLDPLTFATFGVGGAVKTGAVAGAKGATRATAKGVARELIQGGEEELAERILKRGSLNALSAEEAAKVGIRQGPTIGTKRAGRAALPGGDTLARGVSEVLSPITERLHKLPLGGVTQDAGKGLSHVNKFKLKDAERASRLAAKGVKDESSRALTAIIKGAPNLDKTVVRNVLEGVADGSPEAEQLRTLLDNVHSQAEELTGLQLPYMSDYLPHRMTDETKGLLDDAGVGGRRSGGTAAALHRAYGPGDEFFGVKLETASIDEMNQIAKDHGIAKFYEDDPVQLINRYISEMTNFAKRKGIAGRLGAVRPDLISVPAKGAKGAAKKLPKVQAQIEGMLDKLDTNYKATSTKVDEAEVALTEAEQLEGLAQELGEAAVRGGEAERAAVLADAARELPIVQRLFNSLPPEKRLQELEAAAQEGEEALMAKVGAQYVPGESVQGFPAIRTADGEVIPSMNLLAHETARVQLEQTLARQAAAPQKVTKLVTPTMDESVAQQLRVKRAALTEEVDKIDRGLREIRKIEKKLPQLERAAKVDAYVPKVTPASRAADTIQAELMVVQEQANKIKKLLETTDNDAVRASMQKAAVAIEAKGKGLADELAVARQSVPVVAPASVAEDVGVKRTTALRDSLDARRAALEQRLAKVQTQQRNLEDAVRERLKPRLVEFDAAPTFDHAKIAADKADLMAKVAADNQRQLDALRATVAARKSAQRELEVAARETADELFQKAAVLRQQGKDDLATVHALHAQARKAEADLGKLDGKLGTLRYLSSRTKMVRDLDAMARQGLKEMADGRYAEDWVPEALRRLDDSLKPENINALLRTFDRVSGFWRASALLSPGFHERNFFGGMFNNMLAGMDLKYYRIFKRANTQFHKGGLEAITNPQVREAMESAMKNGQFEGADISDISRLVGMAEGGRVIGRNNPLFRANMKMGSYVEQHLRMPLYIDTYIKTGGDELASIDAVLTHHFDYDDLSRAERNVMRRGMAFYTWTRFNLPLQILNMADQPGKYTAYLHLKDNIEKGSEEEGVVPDYFKRAMAIRLPFKSEGNSVYVSPDLPFISAGRALGVNEVMAGLNPVIKTPLEAITNRKFFEGRSFKSSLEETPDAWAPILSILKPLQGKFGLPKVYTADDGTLMMSEHETAKIESLMPLLGRMRRLAPSEEKYQQRALTSWLSFAFGISAKTLDDATVGGEVLRREAEASRKRALAAQLAGGEELAKLRRKEAADKKAKEAAAARGLSGAPRDGRG